MSAKNPHDKCNRQNVITAKCVSANARYDFWHRNFSQIPHWMTLESNIFAWMNRLCEHYNGGVWKFYTLSNGGAFIVPDNGVIWSLYNEMNGNCAEMSHEAAGISACLLAYSHHACRTESEVMTEHFYWLRDYGLSHSECRSIMQIID